jgi:hypothetical protein
MPTWNFEVVKLAILNRLDEDLSKYHFEQFGGLPRNIWNDDDTLP